MRLTRRQRRRAILIAVLVCYSIGVIVYNLVTHVSWLLLAMAICFLLEAGFSSMNLRRSIGQQVEDASEDTSDTR